MFTIGIIGTGPTAIYTARNLLMQSQQSVSITMYEAQDQAGRGTPYHPNWNDPAMLSNIASIEIPPVMETLVAWLLRQTDKELARMGVARDAIDERAFFPRVVLGEYFQDQLEQLIHTSAQHGNRLAVKTRHQVMDVMMRENTIRLAVKDGTETVSHPSFDRVVMATGHVWPEQTQLRPGYFTSPWPASTLHEIGPCHVGIRGTSLSAIDALVVLATMHGHFERDANDTLHYLPDAGTEAFHVTLMSRKGLLPEADFYHPIPYTPLTICTCDVIDALIQAGHPNLLDVAFDLFRKELMAADADYAAQLGLATLTLEDFCEAYFTQRQQHDAFEWARMNLKEAMANQAQEYTVPWRYAILRMHEVIGRIVPHLSAEDHARFTRHFKPVFVDDYATVPHESIARLLALHATGKLDILRIGEDYRLDTACANGGAQLTCDGTTIHFPAFIEAMGQRSLSAREFPFPSLRRQGAVRNATASHRVVPFRPVAQPEDIGGVALDETFHLISDAPTASHLYCLSIPFMLGQFPFAQGITSSHDMAQTVTDEILETARQETYITESMPTIQRMTQ